MNLFTTESDIIVTCNSRFAPYLQNEVQDLGFTILETFVTGVRIKGSVTDCIQLNLNLRCASQVLYLLKEFRAENADDIYSELSHYPWEDIIPADQYFSVTSNVNNASINNSMFANLRVKDAIVDRFREKRGTRPSTGSDLTGVVVHLFWQHNRATIYIDTSGDSLGRHGYRKIPGKAPMLESLASATILASSWDRQSPFVNPMCGAGTLAIEAALIATDARPGLFRLNYGFMHLNHFNEDEYLVQRGVLENKIIEVPKLRIIATDYDAKAIENAKKNAAAAGVADLIEFAVCDFELTSVPPGENGVVFFNPEYGERLGDVKELEFTYSRIGDFLKKKCGGYFGYIFTGNMELAKKIGLKPSRRIEFYNSKIDCRLLEYELYSGSRRNDS